MTAPVMNDASGLSSSVIQFATSGQVGWHAQRLAAAVGDLPGHHLQRCLAPSDQDDRGAHGTELARGRGPDPAARTGDDDDRAARSDVGQHGRDPMPIICSASERLFTRSVCAPPPARARDGPPADVPVSPRPAM